MPPLPANPTTHAALLAFVFVPILLPVSRGAELPLLIVALLGIGAAWRARASLRVLAAPQRLVLLLFACYWLPALASAADAVVPHKTWTEVAGYLRFLPFAFGAVLLLGGRVQALAHVRLIIAAIVALWVADALVQALTGISLGGTLGADRISGVFGDANLKLGPALAVLSPVLLLEVRARFGRAPALAAWLAIAVAVLLAGARAGWVGYALVTLALLWHETPRWPRFALAAVALAGLGVALAALSYVASERFAERVDRTLAFAGGDAAAVDHALAQRLPIWSTAVAMAAAHPVNGVGVRGFRYAYPRYAAADDPWLRPVEGQGALHAHQLLLELACETGAIGLLGWGLGAWLAWRAWRRAGAGARERAFAPALALLAMTFPLNTHFAFYSAFWSLLFWWLLAWYAAALVEQEP